MEECLEVSSFVGRKGYSLVNKNLRWGSKRICWVWSGMCSSWTYPWQELIIHVDFLIDELRSWWDDGADEHQAIGNPWCSLTTAKFSCVLMQPLACSVHDVVAETRQIHTDYRAPWRKRDCTATLSRGECSNPCLDRLLLLFWAHYIEDSPHLLCTGSL